MNISEIRSKSAKPELYEKGTSLMWADPHISKQLLKIHLNPEVDLASRKKTTIESTARWILNNQPQGKKLEILDLGCGPGLYAEIYAREGHKVTGVDISRNSIDYARKEAAAKNLDISYLNTNYLELKTEENRYGLITMIYTDFGVLLPQERHILLNSIYRSLKKGGLFIFDVLNDRNIHKKTIPRNWEAVAGGFWKETPYLALSDSFVYPDEKVILYQHLILDENNDMDVYRFWTHFFSHQDLKNLLTEYRFGNLRFHEDVLPGGDTWEGENVTFCIAVKK